MGLDLMVFHLYQHADILAADNGVIVHLVDAVIGLPKYSNICKWQILTFSTLVSALTRR